MDDTELKELAYQLDDIISKGRSKNTVKKYETYFNKWKKWCLKFPEVDSIPAKNEHVILYLISLIQTGDSYSTIESTIYAIKHFHNVAALDDPTNSKLIDYVLDAAKRLCHQPTKKKSPITPDHIHKIYETIQKSGFSLLHRRNFTMMLLCFAGFLSQRGREFEVWRCRV